MGSGWEGGAERCTNGSSMIGVGLAGFHASVQRFSVRLAPFSSEPNHAPPSSEYFAASSATPQPIGGSFAGFPGAAQAAPASTRAPKHAPASPARTPTAALPCALFRYSP